MSLGTPRARWFVKVNDPLGNHQFDADDAYSLEASVGVNTVGAATLVLPGHYGREKFFRDGLLELWRQPAGGPARLWTERLWFIRDLRKVIHGKRHSWKLTAYDGNYIFADPEGQRGRIVAYNTSNSYTSKLAAADDMMKAVVRENAGTLATDTARNLSTYLAVAPDAALGPVIRKEFARRVVLSVLQELAQAAATAGTYLAFDVVCTVPPSPVSSGAAFGLEFRTFIGQRGLDHRTASGQQVLIGPDFGTMDDVEVVEDATAEENYIYAGGEDVATVRAVATATDSARTSLSPFNRRESWIDARETKEAVALQDVADRALRAGRPRLIMTGTLLDTDQARYGIKWDYGDYLPAQADGINFDVRVEGLTVRVAQEKREALTASVRGESV